MSGPSEGAANERLLLDAFVEALKALPRAGTPTLADGTVSVPYSGEAGRFTIAASTVLGEALLVVYSVADDVNVADDRLGVAIEFCGRANAGLPRANLELDLESRHVRSRASLDAEGADLVGLAMSGALVALVRRVVLASVATLDICLPGARSVVAGTMTPSEADAALDR